MKTISSKKKLQLKIEPLESKVTPHCTTQEECESQGGSWHQTLVHYPKGECMLGQLSSVADY